MHAGSFWRVPYVKTSVRTTRSGTVRYLQLAHNEWDAEAQRSRTRVLHNFGREDEIDKDAVRRLVAALSRLLDPAEALAAAEPGELSVTASRPAGGIHVLDQLWRRLGLDGAVRLPLVGRRLSPETERVLFALVANRALAASSKLAATEWVCSDVHVDGLDEVTDDACYRAMDHLLAIERSLAEQAYFQVTDLLNLEVDLLFFDTTSTYFETEEADEDVPRDAREARPGPGGERKAGEAGFRTHGKSKDSRDDLPQVIVGMAVTRDGIPVRVWSWPGNTADSGLIRQVKADLRRVGPVEGHLGRRPRLHLRGEPPRPHAGRRRVHHRREAPLRHPPRSGPPSRARAATRPSGTTSRSRKSASATTATGSSSATTRTRPNATPPSAPAWSPSSKSSSTAPTPSPPPSAAGSRAPWPAGPA